MVDLSEPPAVTDPTESAALRNAVVHSGQASGSSDGLHAGKAGRDLCMLSAKYECVNCGHRFHKYDVYLKIAEPSMDGQGLNLSCRDCSFEQAPHGHKQLDDEDGWRIKCRTQWLKHGILQDEFYAMRVRPLAWDPGEFRKEVCLIRKSRRLAVSMSANLNHLTADEQLKVVKVIDNWVDEWSNEEEDPKYIAAMARWEPISDLVTEFVDQVLPVLDQHFICRQKHCSMVCRWCYWVHNRSNDQNRCPACAEEHNPWKAKLGYWTTNQVFVTYDEVGLQQELDLLKPGEMAGHAREKQVMILPVMWPDTSKCELIVRVTAIFLSLDRDLMALPPKDRLGFVLEHLSLTAPPKAFEPHEFLQNTGQHRPHERGAWRQNKSVAVRSHRERLHWHEARARARVGHPWEQVEFVRLWGYSMWLTQMAAASLSLGKVSGQLLVSGFVSAATSSSEAAAGTGLQ